MIRNNQPLLRCAIYTRKSTEEGLEQEFNSLDAQRESSEAFIKLHEHEGWVCLPDRYDDGGYSGGDMDRPALQRLMADIEAGKIDVVVVYKVDRLSRSLLDFARMMETFERHRISFVSITQQFNTTTPMGRLVLNVLLSFAQFEREMISERTRDKIAATRRKGKYTGGRPLLGYNVVETKLVVNEDEAERVREIFRLYLEHEALIPVANEINGRGWRTKVWKTKKGEFAGGVPFTKTNLYYLLTNVTYVGKTRYKDEIHQGQHQAIVDQETFSKAQAILARNGAGRGAKVRNKYGSLLRGTLYCAACERTMAHAFAAKGKRRYRYYVCTQAQKNGWRSCPSPSVPAGEIERFVVEQIKCIGRDPDLIRETVLAARCEAEEEIDRLEKEHRALGRQMREDSAELDRLILQTGDAALAWQVDIQDRLRIARRRAFEIEETITALRRDLISEDEAADALAEFDALWETLSPREQARVLELLIERVDYDGEGGNVVITFRPTGIKSLTNLNEEDAQ